MTYPFEAPSLAVLELLDRKNVLVVDPVFLEARVRSPLLRLLPRCGLRGQPFGVYLLQDASRLYQPGCLRLRPLPHDHVHSPAMTVLTVQQSNFRPLLHFCAPFAVSRDRTILQQVLHGS